MAIAAAACTETTIVEPFYRPEGAVVDQAYISPTADFSRYTKLLPATLEIYYPEGPAPDSDELQRLRDIFRTAFLARLEGYELVQEPAPDVMTVRLQIIDLKIAGPEGTYEPTGRLRDLVTRGQLTLLMELRDSVSDRVLARAGETEDGQSTSVSDREASWAEVEEAAQRWAGMFREWLDRNLGA